MRGRRCGRVGLRVVVAASAALGTLALAACGGSPVGMSAQRGSTIVIPLTASTTTGIGYGSYNDTTDPTPVTDDQRGTLIYELVTPSGPYALVTRATSLASVPPRSAIARDSQAYGTAEVVSVVDIPVNAPLGTYPLQVIHRHQDPASGAQLDDAVTYHGQISILPAQIDVTHPDGTLETVTGRSTPFAYLWYLNGSVGSQDLSADVQGVIPDPAVRIHVASASGSAPVWGAELTVTYPAQVIDVVDALETPFSHLTHRATVWFLDDGLGNVDLHAVAVQQGLSSLSLVFQLVDGKSAILDPAQVHVTLDHAWDQTGTEIPATASVVGIF